MMKRIDKGIEIEKQIKKEERIEEQKKITKKFIKFLIIFLIILFASLYYMRFIETNKLNVKEIKVESSTLPKEFHGLKVIQISDIHYMMSTDDKYLKKLVNKINYINPDIVVFTGDLLDSNIEYKNEDYDKLTNILKDITTNNKYYIKGNHDYFTDKVDIILKNSNFIDINNNYDYIYKETNSKIRINGLGSSIQNDIDIESAFNNNEEQVFTITLIHEPDITDEIISYSPDIILAGHSHNGQINIPYIKELFKVEGCKKYYTGNYEINNSKLYINSGIGTSIYKYRLFNPPTINFYRITNN